MGDAGHVLQTARTSPRPVSMQDVGYLHRLWTDPAVRRAVFLERGDNAR
ncbi:MAG: hypothetical protein M3P49_11345 [Actinomycetota bacterium]|nr:hypothetical protein [Actinomycetota bacterium]